MLESAAKQSAIPTSKEENADIATYMDQLREALVECYTTIVHGVSQSANKSVLVKYAPSIILYLSKLVEKDMNPSKVRTNRIILIY